MHDDTFEALIEHDPDGVITEWNLGAERLFGWTRAEAVGMRSERLIPARNRLRYGDELRAFITGAHRGLFHRVITAVDRDGQEFSIGIAFSLKGKDAATVMARVRATSEERRPATGSPAPRDQRYLAILDQIEDACCIVDLRGTYLFINDAFCRLFGLARESILGRNFRTSMGEGRADKLRDLYMQVYQSGEPAKSFEYQIFPQNSSARFVEQTISLERDAEGKTIGFLAIARDCTARKEAELELARAREVADAANRAKGEFLANMSHEIRTPMNGIIGMTALALDTELTPYQEDCLRTVKMSAEALLTILNDILDFSKIESRKLELEKVAFSVAGVIGDAMKLLAVRANEKGLELIADVDRSVPRTVVGDPGRLRQILTNLVGNAIKFTERGRVVVSVGEAVRGEGCTTLRFSVTDTGIGIPADKHESVFEAFRQADGSTTRRFGGTGLGLAISTTLVSLMGGQLSLESEPGVGSTFQFTASFDLAAPPVRAPDESLPLSRPIVPAPPLPARSVSVLVAEDNVVNQRVAQGLLQKRGHRVVVVGTGREAIAALERDAFDVVLMDVQMPELGGFEATALIREAERHTGGHVRIVAMTAHAMTGDRERCVEAGMDDYLSKPIDPQTMFAIVEDESSVVKMGELVWGLLKKP